MSSPCSLLRVLFLLFNLMMMFSVRAMMTDECVGTSENSFFRQRPLKMVDPEMRLIVLMQPKAGATVATQLTFEALGVLEEAKSYSSWIHDYREKVFSRQARRRGYDFCTLCPRPEWTCVHVVRNPADRVVSSYIHVMRTKIKNLMPGLPKDATFREFVSTLQTFRNDAKLKSNDGGHAATQYYDCDDKAPGPAQGVLYAPIEMLDEALFAMSQLTGRALLGGGQNFSSSHYVAKKATNHTQGVHDVPFSQLSENGALHGANSVFPEYQDFLQDPDLVRNVFGCLFMDDVRLYQIACGQPWLLRLCPSCSQICANEIAKVRLTNPPPPEENTNAPPPPQTLRRRRLEVEGLDADRQKKKQERKSHRTAFLEPKSNARYFSS